ncbi:uncharacterized protein L969DRAFT_14674 [Mixia osmundae IAM 14324]|nr:uncharacterized protein L969DRAFT_14674 [Mixia osmundae IAM 14324]KEI42476.1 hypothetical protein L969DRAFT_14674 [Mixia osmundae IAM 14324]
MSLDLAALEEADNSSVWLSDLLSASQTGQASETAQQVDLAGLQAKINTLIQQLETATSEVALETDVTIKDIARATPRLAFDLQLMRENALLLRYTLDRIQSTNASATQTNGVTRPPVGQSAERDEPVKEDIHAVMERLALLDLVKTRMEATRVVLREAESWSTLEAEITSLLALSEFVKAAERLSEASKSLVVFRETPEYEQRHALMTSLQNQLEASLSASLIAAITDKDVKRCRDFYAIFSQIQREVEFRNYYFASRRTSILATWSSASLVEQSSSAATQDHQPVAFTAFFESYCADLLALLEEERITIAAIFPDPADTLASFLQSLIESQSPTFGQRLAAVSEYHAARALPELINAYHATEAFCVQVDRVMTKQSGTHNATATEEPVNVDPASARRDRRASVKRLSFSRRSSSKSDISGAVVPAASVVIRGWEAALLEPFLDLQSNYSEFERMFLLAELSQRTSASAFQASLSALSEIADARAARMLIEHGQSAFAMAEDGLRRVIDFTHGYAMVGYVAAVDSVLSDFYTNRASIVIASREQQRKKRADADRRRVTQGSAGGRPELDGLDYSPDDWATFQLGIRLLGSCRQLAQRASSFETNARNRISMLNRGTNAREDVREAALGTTPSAIMMLRQSTLNSVEFAELLKSVEAASRDGHGHILCSDAKAKSSELAQACQALLHDVILGPLLSALASYADLHVWTQQGHPEQQSKAMVVQIPTFSVSPTETISRLGEGLFNLPRLFEVYADDSALGFSIETLPFVDPKALHQPSPPAILRARPNQSPEGHENGHASSPSASYFTRSKEDAPLTLNSEDVISLWLTSLALSVLDYLTMGVLPGIRELSAAGASQLAGDLSYIANVAHALDAQNAGLEDWRRMLEANEAQVKQQAALRDSVAMHVQRMRGWHDSQRK